jgi:hypothetical protein
MSAQSEFAAAGAARDRPFGANLFRASLSICGAVLALALATAGCTPATTRLAGPDPADPARGSAGIGYRSTVAPYTSLRPSTPAPWRERNERVAPQPNTQPNSGQAPR